MINTLTGEAVSVKESAGMYRHIDYSSGLASLNSRPVVQNNQGNISFLSFLAIFLHFNGLRSSQSFRNIIGYIYYIL